MFMCGRPVVVLTPKGSRSLTKDARTLNHAARMDLPSIASAVRFSVTAEMRSIAAEQQSHHGLSIVVTSYLVGATNKHRYGLTSFAQLAKGKKGASQASRVFRVVDKLRSVSPALCTPNTALLVVHDVAGIPAVKDSVRYHHVEPSAASNSMNRRWEIYASILREYTFDCVCAHVPMRTIPAACMRLDASRRCYRRDGCRCPVGAVLLCAAREIGDWLGWRVDGREVVVAEAGPHVRSTQ